MLRLPRSVSASETVLLIVELAVVLTELARSARSMPLYSSRMAVVKYSSTRGFCGGSMTGSILVRLPKPRKPGFVTVVAMGLYWFWTEALSSLNKRSSPSDR